MFTRISLAVLSLAILAAPATAQEAAAPVACEGVYGPESSDALVRETFGEDNVVTGTLYGAEGMEMIGTTVYPDDPDRRIEFIWFDEENLTYLSSVQLSPEQTVPGGVRIGMTVAEVAALNGEPFQIGGFWWDYGGYANIQSGALAEMPGGCFLSIRFAPVEGYPEDIDVTPVAGEVQIPSDEPLLAQLDTRVQVLNLGYPWPEDLPQPEYAD